MRGFSTLSLVAAGLLAAGCWSSQESALFSNGGVSSSAGSGSVGGSMAPSGGFSGAQAGTAPTSGAGASASGGVGADAGGGSAGSDALGGEANGGSAGGQPVVIPKVTDCSMIPQAFVSELDGHCYRLNAVSLPFDAAAEACRLLGGHLVSIESAPENEFVDLLHVGEHWIGASDGKLPTEIGVGAGAYAWLSGESLAYSDWQESQPNAFEVDCPGDAAGPCYEHCAFQDDDGSWNDRSCWHLLESVCEWDIDAAGVAEPPPEMQQR